MISEVQKELRDVILEVRGPCERLRAACDGLESKQVRLKTVPGGLQRLREAPKSSPGTVRAPFVELSKVLFGYVRELRSILRFWRRATASKAKKCA